MRKSIMSVCLLFVCLVGVWTFKMNHPINEPEAFAIENDTSWWEDESKIPIASEEWILDPEIPSNYVPVIGEEELYMEIDDSGYVIAYHHREQMEDGTWVWEKVNPDIPTDYEPVEGVPDVYKVTDKDGNVKYLRYIRNKDDTYAFVEVDKDGKEILSKDVMEGKIPANYVHVTGNIYAVYNDKGVLVGYKQRIDNKDGTYSWVDCEEPKSEKSESITTGSITSGISSNIGSYNGGQSGNQGNGNGNNTNIIVQQGGNGGTGTVIVGGNGSTGQGNGNITTNSNADGTYTETEVLTETKISGNWKITYETTITRVYSADGTLKSTKKDGPKEVSKVQVTESNSNAPDSSKIASTLDAELARVSGSVSFNTSLANEVLAELNAERVANGLSPLSMSSSSSLCKMAQLYAADMAIYNHSDFSSPLYGSIDNIMKRFSISGSNPSQNVWRSTQKSASEIHSRFQTIDSSRKARMSEGYTEIGIAVVSKNGYMYICELLAK